MARKATIARRTTETDITVNLSLDGGGRGNIATTIPFFDHMLRLTAKHGAFDLSVAAQGDTEIDDHHLVEDTGICLGCAFHEALGEKKGIRRYGWAMVPMDESLCSVAVDISGRPYLVYQAPLQHERIGGFEAGLIREFFKSFSDHGRMTLHIRLWYGTNPHHMAEAVFKTFALALREAVAIRKRTREIPSTKGML